MLNGPGTRRYPRRPKVREISSIFGEIRRGPARKRQRKSAVVMQLQFAMQAIRLQSFVGLPGNVRLQKIL